MAFLTFSIGIFLLAFVFVSKGRSLAKAPDWIVLVAVVEINIAYVVAHISIMRQLLYFTQRR